MPETEDRVRIVHQNGRFATVPAANLAKAQELGWRVEQVEDAAQRQKGTLLENVATSGAAGVAGGLLALPKAATALGTTAANALGADVQDPLADLSGRQFVEDVGALGSDDVVAGGQVMRAQMEANMMARPLVSAGSELAGNLVGGLAYGGAAGALGKAAAARVGLQGAAAARAATVLGGTIEGGALGADQAAEQAWLRNETATAEQTLASMGLGAVLGGGLAGGLSVAGAGLGKLFGRGARAADNLAAPGAQVDNLVPALGDDAARATSPLERVGEAATKRSESWLSQMSDDAAIASIARQDQRAMRAIGGKSGNTEAIRKVGRLLKEADIVSGARSPEKMLERAEAVAEASGQRIGRAIDKLDEAAPNFDAKEVFSKIDEQVAQYRGGWTPELRRIADRMDDQLKVAREAAEAGTFRPKDLHALRRELDTQIKWSRGTDNAMQDALTKMRHALEDGIEAEMARVGDDLAKEYKSAKEMFRASRWAEETLSKRVGVRDPANRFFSLTDHMGMGAAFMASGGNPVVAAAYGLGNKLLRERGAGVVASVASKLARESVDVAMAPAAAQGTARAVRSMIGNVDERMADSVGTFFRRFDDPGSVTRRAHGGGTLGALTEGKLSERRAAYSRHAEQVSKVASMPDVAASELAKLTGSDLPAVAPGLNAAMAATMTRAAQYLQSVAPAPARDPDSITPHLDEPPPVSDFALREYATRVEGVQNPLSLLDDLASGDVDPLKVEAVKAVWPQVFEQIQTKVFAELALRQEPVPPGARRVLDIALDANGAIEPTLAPRFMRTVQEAVQGAGQSQPQPQPPGAGSADVWKSMSTRADRLMNI